MAEIQQVCRRKVPVDHAPSRLGGLFCCCAVTPAVFFTAAVAYPIARSSELDIRTQNTLGLLGSVTGNQRLMLTMPCYTLHGYSRLVRLP